MEHAKPTQRRIGLVLLVASAATAVGFLSFWIGFAIGSVASLLLCVVGLPVAAWTALFVILRHQVRRAEIVVGTILFSVCALLGMFSFAAALMAAGF